MPWPVGTGTQSCGDVLGQVCEMRVVIPGANKEMPVGHRANCQERHARIFFVGPTRCCIPIDDVAEDAASPSQ